MTSVKGTHTVPTSWQRDRRTPLISSEPFTVNEGIGASESGFLSLFPCLFHQRPQLVPCIFHLLGQILEDFDFPLPEQLRGSRISPDLVPVGVRQELHSDAAAGETVRRAGSKPVDDVHREVQVLSDVRRDHAEDVDDGFLDVFSGLFGDPSHSEVPSSLVTVVPSPGHTGQDVSVQVTETSVGTVLVAGDLFECCSDEDSWRDLSMNTAVQEVNRQEALRTADVIIPGHGLPFRVLRN
ncbi:uncharacterized protein mblac1 isoform X1 [Epinephelus fuscoguttatus]|uniref:uncharacterized protein mblac1 isoform X1 n=1 Tax=Epinephelus fuscoguttatus TaxID=293821 RepID=UPI0020D16328|nr:uncharacterized protein mblac1 isoform X1 [Epinephelus fuscoguttatus]